jgi:hypothetical protein
VSRPRPAAVLAGAGANTHRIVNADAPLYVQDVLVHQHPAALISAAVIWKTLSTSVASSKVMRGVS